MNTTTAPIDPIALYWDKLAAYLAHAFSLFGDPRALAQRLRLSRREHKQVCDFLRPLEAIARGLIFIAALELAPMTLPPTPERKLRARLAMPTNAGAAFEMDQPETWRVSFRVSARMDRRLPAGDDVGSTQPARRQIAGGPSEQVSSAPSAARLEALLRAIEHPEKQAAALARKLAREPSAAHAYTARPSRKLEHKTGYVTLFDLIPLCAEAYQLFLHRKLDALQPDSS